jgi:site-specific recombinase XerD
MTEERTTPLRERMIEDMHIRGIGEKAQQSHIRAIKDFASYLGRPPDTATPEELRSYQLHMTNAGVSPSTFNVRMVALRFFFGVTCGREDMKRHMQFQRKPRPLPIVLSVEEVAELIHVDQGKGFKDHRAMLSPDLLDVLRDYWREARPHGRLFPGRPKVNPISPGLLTRTFTSAKRMAAFSKPATLHTLRHSFAYWNKKAVYGLLFRASAETLITIASDPRHLGARIGMTSVLHTWARHSPIIRMSTSLSPAEACLRMARDGSLAVQGFSCRSGSCPDCSGVCFCRG